jgi:hypothetical protein
MSSTAKERELDPNMDVRMAERLMKRGHMSRKEYEKLLKSLPDSKAKAAKFEDEGDGE